VAKKKSKEELDAITQKVRKLAREGKVTMAPQDRINQYPDVMKRFVGEVLGHPEALYSDMSYLSDFTAGPVRPGTPDYVEIVARTLEEFGIDPTSVMDKSLCDVVEYIAKNPDAK